MSLEFFPSYTSENRLASGPGGTGLRYNALGQLNIVNPGQASEVRFDYDGDRLLAEYSGGNILQRRYVHGPGSDEPVVAYEGSTLTSKRWLHADERGSITAVTNSTGTSVATNKYDEYGNPAATNAAVSNGGRFGYTGQAWLPELGMWYYKARLYNPALGRFMQTDPIGYGDGMNAYNYVGSDPVNFTDPSGLWRCVEWYEGGTNYLDSDTGEIVVKGSKLRTVCYGSDTEVATPKAWFDLYLGGETDQVYLTQAQAQKILDSSKVSFDKNGIPKDGRVTTSDGTRSYRNVLRQVVNTFGPYANSIGTATFGVSRDSNQVVYMEDRYNMNRRPFSGPDARSVKGELLTRLGKNIGNLTGAKPFDISVCA